MGGNDESYELSARGAAPARRGETNGTAGLAGPRDPAARGAPGSGAAPPPDPAATAIGRGCPGPTGTSGRGLDAALAGRGPAYPPDPAPFVPFPLVRRPPRSPAATCRAKLSSPPAAAVS